LYDRKDSPYARKDCPCEWGVLFCLLLFVSFGKSAIIRQMQVPQDQLKTALDKSGLIGRDALAEAEKTAIEKKQKLSDVLLSAGKISEPDIKRLEAHVLGVPFISLTGEKIDFAILSTIPEPIARNHNIIAYKKTNQGLEVAMTDFDDLPTIDFIRKKTGLKILPRLTDTASVKIALAQYKKSLKAEFDEIIQRESVSIKKLEEDESGISEKELKKMAEDLPVVKVVDTLISHAILQGASDIHIEPLESSVIVRYRIDGILHDAMTLPKDISTGMLARIKVLANLKLDEKRLPQDGRFKISNEGENISFRVSTLPIYFGEKAVLRILRENAHGFTLENLGFHGEGLERIHTALRQKSGILLATGPTGCGKTTTLYTILDMLNTPDVNISTVEDPVEYQMNRINQTQVKPEIGLTFAGGLRSLVRQDPDILMVGEIRDGETAGLAINAALTGHLVLSTVHTNSAASTIPRLLDMGVEPFLLVSTVKTIIAQRLVRKLCVAREKYFLKESELKDLSKLMDLDKLLEILRHEKIIGPKDNWKTMPFFRAKKSDECEDGYSGRVGIHEVLQITPVIREMILTGKSHNEIEKQAKNEGMFTMIEDGIFKAALGITSIEEVLRVVSE